MAAAKWIAVHGNAGVSDSASPVNIAYSATGATATPITKQKTSVTGTVHFPLPSPPTGSVQANNLNVELTTTIAEVEHIAIIYGGSVVFNKSGAHIENDLKKLDVSSISATTVAADGIGYGICVTLRLKFGVDDDMTQAVTFQTVGMSFT